MEKLLKKMQARGLDDSLVNVIDSGMLDILYRLHSHNITSYIIKEVTVTTYNAIIIIK